MAKAGEVKKTGEQDPEKLTPKVRKQSVAPNYEWALNNFKLRLATTHVDNTTSGLNAQERHDAIKQRYIEIKGRLPGDVRHKDGMHGTGEPRPTSAQAIAYDEGLDPLAKESEDGEDDDEEINGTTLGTLDE